MNKTSIEWTDVTWNPVTGCTKVSPGCANCYAERITKRFQRHPFEQVTLHPERLDQPLRWKRPQKVFVCSMSDLFHPAVPWDFLVRIFDLMAATDWHTFQVLTKRPGRMFHFARHIWPERGGRWEPIRPIQPGDRWPGTAWPANVWAGTSIEQADDGDRHLMARAHLLAEVPAKVRFLSCEPLLGPLPDVPQLTCADCAHLCFCDPDPCQGHRCYSCGKTTYGPQPEVFADWVIVGGESGPRARPMNPQWAREICTHCQQAGVPFFFKQWGEWSPATIFHDRGWEDAGENRWMYERLVRSDGTYLGCPNSTKATVVDPLQAMYRVGKGRAGAVLDGQLWREFPVCVS